MKDQTIDTLLGKLFPEKKDQALFKELILSIVIKDIKNSGNLGQLIKNHGL